MSTPTEGSIRLAEPWISRAGCGQQQGLPGILARFTRKSAESDKVISDALAFVSPQWQWHWLPSTPACSL